jgi:hypothetical protein
MELSVAGSGVSEAARVNENQSGFKVTLIGLAQNSFDGTWTVQYSPNGEDWLNHEDMTQISGNKTGDLFFAIRWIRLKTEGASTGDVMLHVIQGA